MGVFLTQSSFNRGEVSESAQDRAGSDVASAAALGMVNFVPQFSGGFRKRRNVLPPRFLSMAMFSSDHALKGAPIATYAFQYRGLEVFVQLEYYVDADDKHWASIYLRLCDEEVVLDEYEDTTTIDFDAEVDSSLAVPGDLPFNANLNSPEPFYWYVNFSRMGPSAFITSPYFAIRRVYIDYAGDSSTINYEQPNFYKELYGEAFAYDNSTLVLVDGASASILSSGDTLIFQGKEATIDTIYDYEQTSASTDEDWGTVLIRNVSGSLNVHEGGSSADNATTVITADGDEALYKDYGSATVTNETGTTEIVSQDTSKSATLENDQEELTFDENTSSTKTVVNQWVYDDYPAARAIRMDGTPYSNILVGRNAPLDRPHQPLSDPFGGNPHLSTFHQGRFIVLSTWDNPTRFWASKPQNPFIIQGNAEDSDSPIEYDLAADKAEVFTWVVVQEQILLGTTSAEYVIDSLSDEPLSPGSFGFYKVSEQGGSYVNPTLSDSLMFTVPRGRTSIAAFQYSESVQGFKAQTITTLSSHLFRRGVEKMAYEPPREDTGTSKIYALVRLNGERRLVICNYDEQADVLGWYRVELSVGYSILDILEIGGRVFLVLAGSIPDSSRAQLAYCRLSDEPEGITADLFHKHEVNSEGNVIISDVFLPMASQQVFALDGDYLWAGEFTVNIDDQGNPYIDVTDTDFGLGDPIYVGVPFVSRVRMFPPAVEPEMVNRQTRLIRTLVSVYNTADLRVNDVSALQGPPKTGRPTNALISGTYEVRTLGWEKRPEVVLESSWPYTCTVLSVTREVQVT